METPPARAAQGELTVHQAGKQVQVLRLELDRYEIGCADTNELCFRGASGVSRKHAVFERDGANWCVRDLESMNGTYLNGKRIGSMLVLRSGDRVTIGELNIIFTAVLT